MTRTEFESQLKEMLLPIHKLYKQYKEDNPDMNMAGLSIHDNSNCYQASVLNKDPQNTISLHAYVYAAPMEDD